MRSIEDESVKEELRSLVGNVVVPTLVIGGEVFQGFALNRDKIENILRRGEK